jgi:predicted nucleic acid-binding protein
MSAISDLERGRTRFPYQDSLARLADALALSEPAWTEFITSASRRLAPAEAGLVLKPFPAAPIEDLARAQRVRPVHDPGELGDDIWESDDELAEFLADLRVIRTLALGQAAMRDVVIDTGTASLLQRREAPPWVPGQLGVMREWDERRRGRLEAWTAGRPIIPFDPRIAQLWGELTGQAKLRGRPRPQNHTWIAACCLRYGIPLVALNSADLGDFAEHHGLILLGEREGGRLR